MATSCDKVRALGANMPELVAGLGLPTLLGGALALAMPMLEGELVKVTSGDPAELDAQLDAAAGFILGLRSDDAPPAPSWCEAWTAVEDAHAPGGRCGTCAPCHQGARVIGEGKAE